MNELTEALNSPGGKNLAIVLVFTVAGVTAMVITFINRWYKHRQAEMNAVLKQEMIQRGMSADEIERVLAAGRPKNSGSCLTANRANSCREN